MNNIVIKTVNELIDKMGGNHPLNKTVNIGKHFTKQDLIDELNKLKQIAEEVP